MNLNKITTNIIKTANQGIKNTQKVTVPIEKTVPDGEKLLGELDRVALCAKTSIIHSEKNHNLPEFIYHITSKENYEKILKDNKVKISSWEALSDNGCKGIYFVDKDNFLQKWVGNKEPELFGDIDIGQTLMMWTCKGQDAVAIKIPTSALDLSKLRFRPYLKTCHEMIEKMDFDTLKTSSKMAKEGLPLSDLPKYIDTNEPIEYIYFGDLTPNIFDGFSQTAFSENTMEMINKLF